MFFRKLSLHSNQYMSSSLVDGMREVINYAVDDDYYLVSWSIVGDMIYNHQITITNHCGMDGYLHKECNRLDEKYLKVHRAVALKIICYKIMMTGNWKDRLSLKILMIKLKIIKFFKGKK